MSSALFLFQQTAVVKKRLILDLCYVNKHLWKQSVSLKIGKHFRTRDPTDPILDTASHRTGREVDGM